MVEGLELGQGVGQAGLRVLNAARPELLLEDLQRLADVVQAVAKFVCELRAGAAVTLCRESAVYLVSSVIIF